MHGAMGTVSEDALSELIDQSGVLDFISIPCFLTFFLCAKHQGILLDLVFRFFNCFSLRVASRMYRANSLISFRTKAIET